MRHFSLFYLVGWEGSRVSDIKTTLCLISQETLSRTTSQFILLHCYCFIDCVKKKKKSQQGGPQKDAPLKEQESINADPMSQKERQKAVGGRICLIASFQKSIKTHANNKEWCEKASPTLHEPLEDILVFLNSCTNIIDFIHIYKLIHKKAHIQKEKYYQIQILNPASVLDRGHKYKYLSSCQFYCKTFIKNCFNMRKKKCIIK